MQDNSTLEQAILQMCNSKEGGFAAAVNNVVIPKKDWTLKILQEDDKIILIKLACGG